MTGSVWWTAAITVVSLVILMGTALLIGRQMGAAIIESQGLDTSEFRDAVERQILETRKAIERLRTGSVKNAASAKGSLRVDTEV